MVKKLFASLLLLIPTMAMAGFQVVEEVAPPSITPPPVTPKVSATVSQVIAADASAMAPAAAPSVPTSAGGLQLVALTYIGDPDADIPVVTGFGRNLKLAEALKQILPAGWHAFLKEDMAGQAPAGVNWKGGRRWTEVLDVLANDQNLTIDVDWTKKQLYVGEKITKVIVKELKSVEKPVEVYTFRLNAGESLEIQLQAWGKQAGWHVDWRLSQDWLVPGAAEFGTDFEKAASTVVETLAKNGADIRADTYSGNRTIVIHQAGEAE